MNIKKKSRLCSVSQDIFDIIMLYVDPNCATLYNLSLLSTSLEQLVQETPYLHIDRYISPRELGYLGKRYPWRHVNISLNKTWRTQSNPRIDVMQIAKDIHNFPVPEWAVRIESWGETIWPMYDIFRRDKRCVKMVIVYNMASQNECFFEILGLIKQRKTHNYHTSIQIDGEGNVNTITLERH